MAQDRNPDPVKSADGRIQFSALGLMLFCGGLILASALVTIPLARQAEVSPAPPAAQQTAASSNANPAGPIPAWGEFIVYNINLEQPDEYIGFELVATNRAPQWKFASLTRDQAQRIMLDSGLTADLVSRALSDQLSIVNAGSTIVLPDKQLLLALSPEVRARLYGKLGKLDGNPYMAYPYCFPRRFFQQWFGDHSRDTRGLALARKLFYPRGDGVCFSDIEFLLQQLPSDEERMDILRLLSRQSAVLVRVRIRPDTDVDKLLGYWSRGVPSKDLRPLVESNTRLRDGGNISLLYFLPKFARDRLYTFPMLTWQPDPVMDCHWSTMNFFNDPPDNRFTGTAFTVPYLQTNYVEVAKPELYGDVILIRNNEGKNLHTALHIADDIVFTKNGYNAAQPWMLMHLDDLLTRYTADAPPKVLVYRKRNP